MAPKCSSPNKMRFYFGLVLFTMITLLTSCYPMNHMRSARPMPEKSLSLMVRAGAIQLGGTIGSDDDELDELIKDTYLPYIEASARYGLIPDLSLGLSYISPSKLQIDGAYTMVNRPNYAFAAGIKLSYASFELDKMMEPQEWQTYEGVVPLMLTVEINEEIQAHGSIQHAYRLNIVRSRSDFSDSEIERIRLNGLTFAGSYRSIFLELGFFESSRKNLFYTAGIAYKFSSFEFGSPNENT